MKTGTFILIMIVFCQAFLKGQTRAELEEMRKKNLQEIEYVDRMLKTTATQKKDNLNELRVIGKQLNLREKLINEYGQEIGLLEYRIGLNRLALEMLEQDLNSLKEEYAKAIVSAYKATKGTPALAFILSSSDFNQGYKRLKYIQQTAKYRRNESETIAALYNELNNTKVRLEKDRKNVNDLRNREERQKQMLRGEQRQKERMVNNLSRKERQLKQDLEEKRRIARQIEKEIERLIEEERRKSATAPMSNEMRIIGESFGENRGRLPWPVERGIITGHFGLQPHPVLKNVTEDNIGIEITSSGGSKAKAVFNGKVVRVFAISGANMAVIIRHGKYLTVYQNLVNVAVKAEDDVEIGQSLGDVYVDNGNGGKAVLKFMVYEEKKKLDPEQWLTKK
ncbi:MAG TPA: peptidoglycan DD-metalloendopeptidase family protein [Bacteroidales bacterium]|nr:peptidoglycan DD-metalloendopeptidase family protein [Bacteroidales bacterium]NLD63395.1 peptidoglycan DD-metalloendopeptidase family protein [Bacteroidales bacterium]HNT92429.1 peptidoglycan DD-metalloendopeptidase family protein [Bacteroidales bacterium]HOO65710.1 peptidoglycan DD-metalloendopeptidase family protein [Bacteroidales bacterium]HPE21683.1 peptidoglycan DD-metalloendopeptidase family protein [Bacteroidales bacterium]